MNFGPQLDKHKIPPKNRGVPTKTPFKDNPSRHKAHVFHPAPHDHHDHSRPTRLEMGVAFKRGSDMLELTKWLEHWWENGYG
jgi:hypothetical protein